MKAWGNTTYIHITSFLYMIGQESGFRWPSPGNNKPRVHFVVTPPQVVRSISEQPGNQAAPYYLPLSNIMSHIIINVLVLRYML